MTRKTKTVAALMFETSHNNELNVCFIRDDNRIKIRRVSMSSNAAKMFERLRQDGEDRIRWECDGEVDRYAILNGINVPAYPLHCHFSKEKWDRVPELHYRANMKLFGKSPSLDEMREQAAKLVLSQTETDVILSASWKGAMEEIADPGNFWATDGKWIRCTSRQWWYALEVMWPPVWNGAAFAMGEPACHNKNGAVYHIFYKDSKTDECYTRRDNLRFFNPIRYKAEIDAIFNGGVPPVQPPGQAEVYSDLYYTEMAA